MNELIKVTKENAILTEEKASKIVALERAAKQIKEEEEALKAAILAEMEAKGIIKIDMGELLITYVAPTDRETFDSKALQKDDPDLYDAYIKISPVKSSVRIKVR